MGDGVQIDDRKGPSIDPVRKKKRGVHAPSLVALHLQIVNLCVEKEPGEHRF